MLLLVEPKSSLCFLGEEFRVPIIATHFEQLCHWYCSQWSSSVITFRFWPTIHYLWVTPRVLEKKSGSKLAKQLAKHAFRPSWGDSKTWRKDLGYLKKKPLIQGSMIKHFLVTLFWEPHRCCFSVHAACHPKKRSGLSRSKSASSRHKHVKGLHQIHLSFHQGGLKLKTNPLKTTKLASDLYALVGGFIWNLKFIQVIFPVARRPVDPDVKMA